ncbi:MAG: TetR/AcrR family transcriptional regulator [candidate division Zixibacteria bacterium]|nr:TetR/AcrR family transcriptional regulator [candidate division Zixibacteria bacterium]MBU1470064.1 TetR/AcrR family transcriptional regulator [candidate division Zixibacteria bacterium]MBU2624384.1 TetR/AcrR family transcriptional regulator [candidate division Zixibacteria bacterium]
MATHSSGTKSKPSVRHHDKYEKRLSLILKAASKVIARDGFAGASVRDVAAKGKIGLSGIYYYFKSKDELLYAIQHHSFSTLVRLLKERLETCSSPEDRLKAVIDNHFQFFVKNRDEFRVCVHEMESLSGKYYKTVLKIRQEYFQLVRRVIDEVLRGAKHETDITTLFLFGSLNWVYMWYDPEKDSDINKLSSQYLRVLLNGINKSQEL